MKNKLSVEVYDGEKFMHRIVHSDGDTTTAGEWATYTGVALLRIDGVDYFAVTDYYDGVFATNVPLKVSFP